MDPTLISILVCAGVIATVVCAGVALMPSPGKEAEQRLEGLTAGSKRRPKMDLSKGILLRPQALGADSVSELLKRLPRLDSLARLYEQADVGLPFRQFLVVPVALVLAAAIAGVVLGVSLPVLALASGGLAL